MGYYRDRVKSFKGKVKIQDVQNEFDILVNTINENVEKLNSYANLDVDDFYIGSTQIPSANYTLTLGALKSILAAYNNVSLGGTVVKMPTNENKSIVFPSLVFKGGEGIHQTPLSIIDKPARADVETNPEVGKVVGYDTMTDKITNQNNVVVSPSGMIDTATEISSDNFMIQYGNDSIPWILQENEYYSFIRVYLNEYTPAYTYGAYFCGMGVSNSKYTPFVQQVGMPIPRIICSLNSNKCGTYPSSLNTDFKVVNSNGEVLRSYNLSESFDENTIIQNDYRVAIVDEYMRITYIGDSTSYGYFDVSVKDGQNHYIVVNKIEFFLLPYSSVYSSLEGTETLDFQNNSPLLLTPMHRTRITQYSPGGTTILPSGQTNPNIVTIANVDWRRDEYIMNTTEDNIFVNPDKSPAIIVNGQAWANGNWTYAIGLDNNRSQFLLPQVASLDDNQSSTVQIDSKIIQSASAGAQHKWHCQTYVYAPIWIPKGLANTVNSYAISKALYYTTKG